MANNQWESRIHTRTAHWALLNVAADLVRGARRRARQAPEEASWRCAGVVALVAASLEACINVYAGFYYTLTDAGKAEVTVAGWPDKWLEMGGHRAHCKWQVYAKDIVGADFTKNKADLRDWQNRIIRLFRDRNDLVMHFKGTHWTNDNLDARWATLTPARADELLKFARTLVSAFERAFFERPLAGERGNLTGFGLSHPDGRNMDRAGGMTAVSDLDLYFQHPAIQTSQGERGDVSVED